VALDGAAPSGFAINLSNNNTNAALEPSSFSLSNFSGNPATAQVTINTRPVATDAVVTIGAGTVSGRFTVLAPRIRTFSLSANIVTAGTPVTGTVTLTGPSPGVTINPLGGGSNLNEMALSSSNTTAATVPPFQPVSGTSTTFNVTTGSVTSAQCTAIKATYTNNASVFLGVSPGQSSNLTFSLPSVTAVNVGSSVSGTIGFGGTIFGASLSSSNPNVATVSPSAVSSVRLTTGGSGNGFQITGVSSGCAMITARNQNVFGQVTQSSIMVLVNVFVSGELLPNKVIPSEVAKSSPTWRLPVPPFRLSNSKQEQMK
jgi:hypothetical protein